jgi:hypothetical protein
MPIGYLVPRAPTPKGALGTLQAYARRAPIFCRPVLECVLRRLPRVLLCLPRDRVVALLFHKTGPRVP